MTVPQPLMMTDRPPGMGEKGGCRIVRGNDSLPHGSLVFYEMEGLPAGADMLGELVITEVKGWADMPFVRFLELGTKGGRYTLRSMNGSVMEDVEIEWAAVVKWIRLPTGIDALHAVRGEA